MTSVIMNASPPPGTVQLLMHSNSIFKSLVTYDARLIFCGWPLLFWPLACLDYVTHFKAA